MKSRQGAELPDSLLVAEQNVEASTWQDKLSPLTKEEVDVLMCRRFKTTKRLKIFERRGKK